MTRTILISIAILLSSCTKECRSTELKDGKLEMTVIYNGDPDEPMQEYTVTNESNTK